MGKWEIRRGGWGRGEGEGRREKIDGEKKRRKKRRKKRKKK